MVHFYSDVKKITSTQRPAGEGGEMILHIPVWAILILLSIIVIIWAFIKTERNSGGYCPPLLEPMIIFLVIMFWVGYGISKLIK